MDREPPALRMAIVMIGGWLALAGVPLYLGRLRLSGRPLDLPELLVLGLFVGLTIWLLVRYSVPLVAFATARPWQFAAIFALAQALSSAAVALAFSLTPGEPQMRRAPVVLVVVMSGLFAGTAGFVAGRLGAACARRRLRRT